MVIFREQKKHTKDTGEGNLWDRIGDACETGDSNVLGFAVDIGTTTVVMTAFDRKEKKLIGSVSMTNAQTKLGADVMMRIMHCMEGRAGTLHRMIVEQIDSMAEMLWNQYTENRKEITKEQSCFFVVGNTTMCHLFLDKSVGGLAGYPFETAYQGSYHCLGGEIGMEHFAKAKICVLSGIAAHVGSDALAVIGAEELYQSGKVQLAVDLGTNAEIVLNCKGIIRVCSTAAGPAFEGKGIACGMAAKAGAVAEVRISANNGNILLGVIEGSAARGICSSGLVDLLAQLRKCRVLLEDGYLLSSEEAREQGIHPEICCQLVERKGQHAFLLSEAAEGGREIYLLQSDIRNLQLAKGAIQAGIVSILAAAQLSLEDVDELVVAGVLGSCVKKSSALGIGLFPAVLTDKIHFAGNAAGKGAALGLLDDSFAKRMEALAPSILHIELAQMPDFQTCLMQAMDLRQWL